MNTLTDHELHELVMMLQSTSPLGRLSNMEARTVIELMQQRGYKITKPAALNDRARPLFRIRHDASQPEVTALVGHAARAKGQKPSEWNSPSHSSGPAGRWHRSG